MDYVENTNAKSVTSSDLSQWVGPDVSVAPPTYDIRNHSDTVEPDRFDWTNRLFALHELSGKPSGWSLGPSAPDQTLAIPLFNIFRVADILTPPFTRYRSFVYDSIEVRATISDPKGLVGGVHLGWYPFIDHFDKNPVESIAAIKLAGPTQWFQWQSNFSPNTQLAPFGTSADLSWSIPWTFKTPNWLTSVALALDNSGPDERSPWGEPVFWWWQLPSAQSLVAEGLPALLKIFISFKGLRFFGPGPQLSLQSGLEVVAAAEVATSVASALGTAIVGDSFLDRFLPKEEISEIGLTSTYDEPKSVQLAYFGDTTSCGFPLTTPIFSPFLSGSNPTVPEVHEFLSRPQYLTTFVGDGVNVHNNPLSPMQVSTPTYSTWLRFFGMLNRYWRGTLNVHFIILGHPLVEVEFKATVRYLNSNNSDPLNSSLDFATHTSLFPGTKHIVVPLPFLTTQDYIPVFDAYPDDDQPFQAATTFVNASIKVVSFVTPEVPVIPCAVYISAAPDFAFYQPIPPGLYNVAEFADVLGDPPPLSLQLQVGLPMMDQIEVARTRAALTTDPKTLVHLRTLNDYMKIWSRCVPFIDYNNDVDEEPIPSASVGFKSASWYPPIDRTADLDANNSWYFSLDYIALLSSLFLYYRGSMGFKLVTIPSVHSTAPYVFVALGDPVQRALTHCPFDASTLQLPPQSNFGTGAVVTPVTQQPILELSLPYRGDNIWSYSINNAYTRPFASLDGAALTGNAEVLNNLVLLDDGILADAMFRKISPDFALGIEFGMPPFTMWAARGFDWAS